MSANLWPEVLCRLQIGARLRNASMSLSSDLGHARSEKLWRLSFKRAPTVTLQGCIHFLKVGNICLEQQAMACRTFGEAKDSSINFRDPTIVKQAREREARRSRFSPIAWPPVSQAHTWDPAACASVIQSFQSSTELGTLGIFQFFHK